MRLEAPATIFDLSGEDVTEYLFCVWAVTEYTDGVFMLTSDILSSSLHKMQKSLAEAHRLCVDCAVDDAIQCPYQLRCRAKCK